MWTHWRGYLIISSVIKGSLVSSADPKLCGHPYGDGHQEAKGFFIYLFFFYYVFWDFLPHLLCGRSTWCVVATWCDLRGEINALLRVTLGFPIVFQFSVPNFLNFSTVHFPFHFSQLPIITMSFFLSKLLVIFSEPVCSVAKFPTSSFWGMPFFLSLFFFYCIDIEYDKFLFLFLFYLFIYLFWSLGFLGFIFFPLFSDFPWLIGLRLG